MKILTDKCCADLLSVVSEPDLRYYVEGDKFEKPGLIHLKPELPFPDPSAIKLDPAAEADCRNSIAIFEHFLELTPVQANDRRLWVTLTHTTFLEYSRQRWKITADSSPRTILDRFHFEGASLATRVRNSIARLWWSAFITYDPDRNDPFELTKYLWSKQDIYMGLVERTFGTYRNVVHGFLEFYSTRRYLKEAQLRRLFTAMNAVGGVKPLAVHSKDDIIAMLKDFCKHYGIKEKPDNRGKTK